MTSDTVSIAGKKTPVAIPTTNTIFVDIDTIIRDEKRFKNIRRGGVNASDPKIQELKQSIASVGLLQPLIVWPGNGPTRLQDSFYLIAGFRRLRAIEEIRKTQPDQFTQVEARIFEGTEQDARIVNTIENVQRENLTYGEEVEAYIELSKLGMPTSEIAMRVGKSPGWVGKLMSFKEKLSPPVYQAFYNELINYAIADDLCLVPDKEQERRLNQILNAHAQEPDVTKTEMRKVRAAIAQAGAEATGRAAPRPGAKKIREVLKLVREKAKTDKSLFFLGVQQALLLTLGEIKEIRKPPVI